MEDIDKKFLIELADIIEKYGAQFYYTNNDDGIHICTRNGKDCFVGFVLEPNELRYVATSNA